MRFTPLASSLMAVAMLCGIIAALAGCAKPPEPITEIKPLIVPVPVATGCIAETGRPEQPKPIKDKVTSEEWQARAPGAKAETIRAQAGERMNYEDADRAATSECH